MTWIYLAGAILLVFGLVEIWVRYIEPKIPTNHDDMYDDRG